MENVFNTHDDIYAIWSGGNVKEQMSILLHIKLVLKQRGFAAAASKPQHAENWIHNDLPQNRKWWLWTPLKGCKLISYLCSNYCGTFFFNSNFKDYIQNFAQPKLLLLCPLALCYWLQYFPELAFWPPNCSINPVEKSGPVSLLGEKCISSRSHFWKVICRLKDLYW